MKFSTFKAALAENPNCTLALLLPNGESLPAHFHITEVGRTEKKFVDCGGKIRDLALVSLQVWVAADVNHRLAAGKLDAIFDKASALLGGDDPEMQVECQESTIGLFAIEDVGVENGSLVFTLANRHTACLALEVCVPESSEEESCRGIAAGCCG